MRSSLVVIDQIDNWSGSNYIGVLRNQTVRCNNRQMKIGMWRWMIVASSSSFVGASETDKRNPRRIKQKKKIHIKMFIVFIIIKSCVNSKMSSCRSQPTAFSIDCPLSIRRTKTVNCNWWIICWLIARHCHQIQTPKRDRQTHKETNRRIPVDQQQTVSEIKLNSIVNLSLIWLFCSIIIFFHFTHEIMARYQLKWTLNLWITYKLRLETSCRAHQSDHLNWRLRPRFVVVSIKWPCVARCFSIIQWNENNFDK